ncbi:Uncharacterised protein [Vibrio cholerae]|nr:Uncharacterised protein [Vibrio cholerae]
MSLYPALYSSTASPSLFSQFSLIKHTSKDFCLVFSGYVYLTIV